MKKTSLLIVLTILSFGVLAQQNFEPGYILTKTNDSIWGELAYRGKTNNCKSCLFKNSSGEMEEYSPQFILAYGFIHGEAYRSKPIKTDKNVEVEAFLQLILAGKVNLYVYNDSLYKERIFIEKEGLGINELRIIERHLDNTNDIYKHKEYIGYLKVYLSDSKIPLDLKNTKLSLKEIQKLILKYNSGFYYPSKSYPLKMKTKRREKPLRIGIGAGLSYSFGSYRYDVDYPVSISDDYRKVNQPGFILNLSFKFPYFFNGKFSVNTGFSYQKLNYQVEYNWPIGQSHLIDYSQDNWYIPLHFVYEILKTKVTPYVNAGAVFIINNNEPNGNIMKTIEDDYSFIIQNDVFMNNITYLIGIGLKFYPGKHLNIDLNITQSSYYLLKFETSEYDNRNGNELYNEYVNYIFYRQFSTSLSVHYQF